MKKFLRLKLSSTKRVYPRTEDAKGGKKLTFLVPLWGFLDKDIRFV
jgi:hypothetical protein